MTPDERIGEQLRRARVAADLSQDSIAERLGIGRRSLVRYENGERTFPAALLEPWALACGLPPADLAAAIWGHKKSPTASPQPGSE